MQVSKDQGGLWLSVDIVVRAKWCSAKCVSLPKAIATKSADGDHVMQSEARHCLQHQAAGRGRWRGALLTKAYGARGPSAAATDATPVRCLGPPPPTPLLPSNGPGAQAGRRQAARQPGTHTHPPSDTHKPWADTDSLRTRLTSAQPLTGSIIHRGRGRQQQRAASPSPPDPICHTISSLT